MRIALGFAASLAMAANIAHAQTGKEEIVVVGSRASQSTMALDETSGTASRLGVSLRDLPVSGAIVSQEVIQERGAATALDAVLGAVGVTGGVTLGATPRFSSRGFTVNNITVLRDGIRQNTLAQSARTLDPFVFSRIEVLKGPASVLYGEGAIAGAINLVTKEADGVLGGQALASYGAWETYRTAAGFGAPLGDLVAVRLDAVAAGSDGYVDRSGYERQAASGSARWGSDRFSISAHLDWSRDDVDTYFGTPLIYDGVVRADGTTAVARANLAAGDRLINARIDGRTRKINYNVTNGFSESEYVYSRLVMNYAPLDTLDFRLTAYRALQDQNYVNSEGFTYNPVSRLVERDALGFIYRDDELLGVRFDGRWAFSLNGREGALSFGVDRSKNDQVRGTRPAAVSAAAVAIPAVDPFAPALGPGPLVRPAPNAQAEVEITAVYGEALVPVTDSFKLVAGLRFDDIELTRITIPATTVYEQAYDPTTGRIGAVWTIARDLDLYAAYTEAVDPVVQLVSQTASSADFGLQKGRQSEVGLKWTTWDGKLDATVALYDIEKTDILTSTIVNGVRVSQQIGGQSSQGVEVAAALRPSSRWSIEANAAYTDAQFDQFNENLGAGVIDRAGKRPDNVPEWSANVFVTRRFDNGVTLQGGARHVGERFANNANSLVLDAYTLLDASLGFTLGPAAVTLRGRNLSDEEYAAWQVFTTTPFLHLGDPRSFEVEFSAKF